ncbi:MAG: hypothetical protein ABH879_10465 [archaeon]
MRKIMWKTLADIDSARLEDLHEYHSRPTEAVLRFFADNTEDMVIYGPSGKFSIHPTLMALRAIKETGTNRTIDLVKSPRTRPQFERFVEPFRDMITEHRIDLAKANIQSLEVISNRTPLAYYFVGDSCRRQNESDAEYAAKCDTFGYKVPFIVINHHRQGSSIVVMGSYNPVACTRPDNMADDHAPLNPAPDSPYGWSILAKEKVIDRLLDVEYPEISYAAIVRGGFFTDGTYSGLLEIIERIAAKAPIDLSQKNWFQLLSDRDAAAASLRAADLVGNPPTRYNLSGTDDHIVCVEEAAHTIAEEMRQYPQFAGVEPNIMGSPRKDGLLANGFALCNHLGFVPVDSLADLIHAQVFWYANNGYLRDNTHRVGEQMRGMNI